MQLNLKISQNKNITFLEKHPKNRVFFIVCKLTSKNTSSTLNFMTKTALDFKIVPIFNQDTLGVWTDFIRIEATCDTELHKLSYPTQPLIRDRASGLKKELRQKKHPFAFGAYNNEQMIGFTFGSFYEPSEMYLERLYVLPKYHRCGIGTQLLKAAEQTATIFATKVTLSALKEAVDFYQLKNGYEQFEDMEKELSPISNCIVPVFQWVKQDFKLKIATSVDTMALKQSKYQPIFVHINYDYEIDAVATCTKDGTHKIWANYANIPLKQSKSYRDKLLQELSKIK